MSNIPTSEELIEIQEGQQQGPTNFKLGVVVALFPNNTAKITFDSEDQASEKQYAYLSSYTPSIGDRVLLAAVSGSYVILGKVNYNVSPGGGGGVGPGEFTTLDTSGKATLQSLEVTAGTSLGSITFRSAVTFNVAVVAGNTFRHTGSQIAFFNASLQSKKTAYYANSDAMTRQRLNELILRLAEYGLITASN